MRDIDFGLEKSYILLFFSVFILSFSHRPVPRTFYVATTGNDQNDGLSPATAWQSLAKLNQQNFEAGDQILLQGNAVFKGFISLTQEDAGTPEQPVTIQSFGTGRATIQNADSTAIQILNAGGIVVKDLILSGIDRTKNRGFGLQLLNTLPNANKCKAIQVENITAASFGRDGIFVGGQPQDGSQSGFEDVKISHCEMFDNQYHGLFVTGFWDTNAKGYANKNLHITHCTAHDNTGDPFFLENHSGSGMEIDDVENALIEYCVAHNNGYLCNSKVGGPCGIWLHAANKSIIQHCVSVNNRTGRGLDGAGFDLDGGTTNCIIQHCYARDNDGAGILVWNYNTAPHELSHNIIRFNVLENNGRKNFYADLHIGTDGTPIHHFEIHNNTIYSSPQPGAKAHCLAITDGQNEHFNVHHNLFISNGTPLLSIDKKQNDVRFNQNAYWATNKRFEVTDNKVVYRSLADWQRATQQEKEGLYGKPKCGALGTTELPEVTQIKSLKAYHPLPNSPLLRNGKPCIGAF